MVMDKALKEVGGVRVTYLPETESLSSERLREMIRSEIDMLRKRSRFRSCECVCHDSTGAVCCSCCLSPVGQESAG